jgi:ankyrin repeat protein
MPLQYVVRNRPKDESERKKIASIMEKFVQAGIDINQLGKYAETALHQSISRNNEFCAKWLIDHGADVNVQTR